PAGGGAPLPAGGGHTYSPARAEPPAGGGRADAKGSLSGLSLETGPGHLVRALCEGVAAQVVGLADAVAEDTGTPLESLRVDGGLTRSDLLMQTQADLLQLPVEISPLPDATALGVGAVARLGLDPAMTVERAAPRWRPRKVFEPRIGAAEAAERLGVFRTEVAALIARTPAGTDSGAGAA
ncbi:FGGY-family carbohydrate kinase, partial [Streptomyces niveus]|uniref:FGGY-family carbohydrate kinase n=1 Tax=Streptomyces niveus TaxID=193462 RepID=UPI0035E23189